MIEIKNVTKKLDNNIILDDINLKFADGNIYGLVGRNGSGKSMLLKTICGFIAPDEGKVIVNNVDLYKTGTFPNSIAALIERPEYLPDLNAYENLKLIASIKKVISDDDIYKILRFVELDPKKPFKKYSLGMRQKLGIAEVLMENPNIMILDEPFNGLEDETAQKIRMYLIEKKKEGKLIIIATHLKEDIKELCDEIITIKLGKVINE